MATSSLHWLEAVSQQPLTPASQNSKMLSAETQTSPPGMDRVRPIEELDDLRSLGQM